jgi:hypothetical protein
MRQENNMAIIRNKLIDLLIFIPPGYEMYRT